MHLPTHRTGFSMPHLGARRVNILPRPAPSKGIRPHAVMTDNRAAQIQSVLLIGEPERACMMDEIGNAARVAPVGHIAPEAVWRKSYAAGPPRRGTRTRSRAPARQAPPRPIDRSPALPQPIFQLRESRRLRYRMQGFRQPGDGQNAHAKDIGHVSRPAAGTHGAYCGYTIRAG